MSSLDVVEVVLVQYKLVQKSEVLYAFMPNKSHAYFLKVKSSNLVFLKTYNTKTQVKIIFDKIIITFTDQNGRP